MIFENIEQYVTILKEWLPKDASIAIITDGVYQFHLSGAYDIGIETGTIVEEDDLAFQVQQKKTKVERLIHRSKDETPYYGIGYPIRINEQEAVAVIALPPFDPVQQADPFTFLTGKREDCWCPIAVEEISHIESMQKKTWFFKNDEQYQSMYTLKELECLLPEYFLRIHRSYIVNIKQIAEISRDFSSNIVITLKNNEILSVSQSYTANVRRALGF